MHLPEKYRNAYTDLVGNNLRFAIIQTAQDYFSRYLIKGTDKNFSQLRTKEDILEKFLVGYPEITHEVVTNSNDIFFSRLVDISPRARRNKPWYRGNHLMIGDSIHPTTPNMANGACLSIEDGYLLGNLLTRFESPQEVFDLFQKDRVRKIDRVVVQSWLFGKSMLWNNKVMTRITEKFIQLTPQFLFDAIYSSVLRESKLLPPSPLP